MAAFSSFSSLSFLLLFSIVLLSRAIHGTSFIGIDVDNPVIDVIPFSHSGQSSVDGRKDVSLCERVRVSGHSRLKLGSYANFFRVTLTPSAIIPERLHSKIQVCFHRNASLGLCQCEKDEWGSIQNGLSHFVMSPYEERYIDVKFISHISGSVTVAVEEGYQRWRLCCLALGFVVLLLAPFVSSWVPFYYSSSMAVGIFLVIIIFLFQGMKLLPTGRKNIFYLTIYGSILGAGSFVFHHFSVMINSILVSFGMSEEMHNPVAIFVIVGVVLSGAALGYWIVRKFVISKDGSVDTGVSQFVKWAMRIIGTTFIFQSTLDTLLAMGALATCIAMCNIINSAKQHYYSYRSYSRQLIVPHGRAEFYSSPRMGKGKMWGTPYNSPSWSNSPVKGVLSSRSGSCAANYQDYYSTFHETGNRKKFSRQDWEDFTRESTRQAIAELTASPEFTDWMIEHADRIKLLPSDSSDESVGSKSNSSADEDATGSFSRFSLFSW